jgi:polyphosphate kinase 2 (PPK2 family)
MKQNVPELVELQGRRRISIQATIENACQTQLMEIDGLAWIQNHRLLAILTSRDALGTTATVGDATVSALKPQMANRI